jgi:hypothetical protein
MAPELPPKKARQGRLGFPVLLVLVAAFVLLAIGWWAVEMYGEAIDPVEPAAETTTTQ